MNSFAFIFAVAVCVPLSSAWINGDKKEPEDCVVSLWGSWGECENKGTFAEQSRTRRKTMVEKNGGTCNYKLADSKCCAFDCRYTMTNWTSCCNTDTQSRSTSILAPAKCGGNKCPTQDKKIRKCGDGEFEGCCAVDCQLNEWTPWPSCDVSCEKSGNQTRTRTVKANSKCGGKKCNVELVETRQCQGGCCPVDCQLNGWAPWSKCDASCEQPGKQTRSRSVKAVSKCGGEKCSSELAQIKQCQGGCCPVDCKMSPWSDWSMCNASCDATGHKTRSRSAEEDTKCGGKVCGHRVEKIKCQGPRCECKFNNWVKQNTCSGDSCQSPSMSLPACGNTFQLRSRTAEIVLNATSIQSCCQINFHSDKGQQTYLMMHSPKLDDMLCPQNNMTLHQESAINPATWQQRASACYSNLNQLNMIVDGPFSLLFSTESFQWISNQRIIINTVLM